GADAAEGQPLAADVQIGDGQGDGGAHVDGVDLGGAARRAAVVVCADVERATAERPQAGVGADSVDVHAAAEREGAGGVVGR
ncbi:hypothetical protein DF186_22065, partial [Enterococcus hirae]